MRAHKSYQIPFNEHGNMLPKITGCSSVKEWKDNYEFVEIMNIYDCIKERSDSKFILKDTEDKIYSMLAANVLRMITYGYIHQGSIMGVWTFEKQGFNYTLKFIRLPKHIEKIDYLNKKRLSTNVHSSFIT